MTGRVLSEEELNEVERLDLEFLVIPCLNENNIDGDKLLQSWNGLIATIRDRDKTISELRSDIRDFHQLADNRNHVIEQNTILREALEQIECVERGETDSGQYA